MKLVKVLRELKRVGGYATKITSDNIICNFCNSVIAEKEENDNWCPDNHALFLDNASCCNKYNSVTAAIAFYESKNMI